MAFLDRFTFLTGIRRTLSALQKRGITPTVDTIVPGSWIAFGAEVRRPRFGSLHIGGEVDGRISVRDFRDLGFRLGYVERRQSLIELRTSDSALDRMFDDVRPEAGGAAVYIEQRYRRSPILRLVGSDGLGGFLSADFGVSGTTTDAVVQLQPTRVLGFSARAGVLDFHLRPGENESVVDAEEVFTGKFLSAEAPEARYATLGFGTTVDGRDIHGAPTKGGLLAGVVWRYDSRTSGLPSFTRVSIDGRIYRSIAGPRHVLAARVLASEDISDGGLAPFYLLPWLGGGHMMRGFHDYWLRGGTLVTGSLEYRWRVTKYLEIAPFVDAGQVTRAPLAGTPSGVLVTPGFGVRMRGEQRVWVRLDMAHGLSGWHFIFATAAAF